MFENEVEVTKPSIEGLISPESQDGTEFESKIQSGSVSSISHAYGHVEEDLSWERSDEFSQHDFIASDLESDLNDDNSVAFDKLGSSQIAMKGDAGCANLAFARQSTCSTIKLDGFSIALNQALKSMDKDMDGNESDGNAFDSSDDDQPIILTKRIRTGYMGPSAKVPASKSISKQLGFKKSASTKITKEPKLSSTEAPIFFWVRRG